MKKIALLIIIFSLFTYNICSSMTAVEYDHRATAYDKQNNYVLAIKNYNRATAYGKQGNYNKAIQNFTRAIELKPDLHQAYYNRGVVYDKQGKYDQAIQDYSKTIELAPKCVKAYNNLAWLYATAKNKSYRNGKKTVIFALKAIKLQESAKCIDTLGAAYVENKQHEKAIETYKKAIEIDRSCIKHYQKSLKEKGYYVGVVDGVFSSQVEKAMRKCIYEGQYL